MTTIAQIQLSHLSKRMDIPRVLCAIDAFDEAASKRLEDLFYKAKLIDLHYQMVIYTESKQRKRLSAESRLNRRLKELEKRAQKASSLFWEDIVKDTIKKRPNYYSLEGIDEQDKKLDDYMAEYDKKLEPVFTLDTVFDWVNRNSPFINPELDKLMKKRYESLERRKMIENMTDEQRKDYFEEQRKKVENTALYKNAFAAEGEGEMMKMMEAVK